MKTLTLAFLFSCTICAAAADLTGNWVAITPRDDGTVRRTYFDLKQEGSRITGQVRSNSFYRDITDGTGGPDGFTLTVTFGNPNRPRQMKYEGKLVGDELQVTTQPRPDRPAIQLVAHRAPEGEGAMPARLPLPALHDVRYNGLAKTPPMGWNSWNKFAGKVDDAAVRAAADAIASNGMKDAGYTYINIDDTWQGERDAQGNIQPNKKFPDMKALADYVHSKGLKIGIYSGPGPATCAGYEGSYGHEAQDAKTYAAWGFDYLKYDWCSAGNIYKDSDMQAVYQKMGDALLATGRPIVFSLCQYGREDVWKWGPQVDGNLWRTTGDIQDNWNSMTKIGFSQGAIASYAGPGHWNDPDMLEIGNGGMTDTEYRTHMSLWSMLSAPLLAGNDLQHQTAATLAILTNRDVIAIDQDPKGKEATRASQTGDQEVWVKDLADGSKAVALFNRAADAAPVAVKWADLGYSATPTARARSVGAQRRNALRSRILAHRSRPWRRPVASLAMSSIVAGVDFGTLSVRVSIFDDKHGRLGEGLAEYPLHRKRDDPDYATQSHADHMNGLVTAARKALQTAGVKGADVKALALDTTGSSVIPVGENLEPLDEYYLWADHRSWREAAEITRKAHEHNLQAIEWCGGVYSSEWGFSKLLHWLRHNPDKRGRLVSAFEHCDYVATVLCGIRDLDQVPRSICAMGHKWMWSASLGGLPPEEFLVAVDPLLKGVRAKLAGRYQTSESIAGKLSPEWAAKLGISPGALIPIGAFDAHWDAVGAGIKLGDVVNVVGTSTCIIGLSDQSTLVPGVCGVVPGSVEPHLTGIEAGLSAVGDMFEAIAKRAGSSAAALSQELTHYRAGQTGLLRMTWDNGDRTVLVNPELGGITLGWNLASTAADELFASIEGTAFHTRIILERMEQHGAAVRRIINGGGIPQKNDVLNQVYANVLNKPILVPQGNVTSLGSAIFAFLAAKAFPSIDAAQDALCPPHRVFTPDPASVAIYEQLYPLYKQLYFSFGKKDSPPSSIGNILPELRGIAAHARQPQ